MEDVFLKVGSLSEKGASVTDSESGHGRDLSLTSVQSQMSRPPAKTLVTGARLKGVQLWRTRMWGLLAKRVVYASRRWIFFTAMALVPLLIALICQLVVNDTNDTNRFYEAIQFDPNSYAELYDDVYTVINADSCADCKTLAGEFQDLVAPMSEFVQPLTDANLTSVILEAADSLGLAYYREDFVLAGDFQRRRHCLSDGLCTSDYVELIGVWNSVPCHARPIAQNAVSNSLLRFLLKAEDLRIATTNHPLPKYKSWEMDILTDSLFLSGYPFAYGVALSLGVGILAAAFVVFPLAERITGAKQVQLMTGVDAATFWLSNIICDFALYSVSVALALGLLVLMDEMHYFTTNGCTGTMVLILLLYALCAIPMSYAFSHLCSNPASGFALLIVINILAGAIAPTAVWLLRLFGDHDDTVGLVVAAEVVRYLFALTPAFPLARSIMAVVQVQEENLVCENGMDGASLEAMCGLYQSRPETLLAEDSRQYAQCCSTEYVDDEVAFCGQQISFLGTSIEPVECHTQTSFYTWDALTGINLDLIFFLLNILFYCGLVIALERGYINRLKFSYEKWRRRRDIKRGKIQADDCTQELLDDDVCKEQIRIKDLYCSATRRGADALVVTDLSRRFRSVRAVCGLSFGVHHGECFGLLGVNGAGKTTTFRMLTGDEAPNSGAATVMGFSLASQRKDFLRQIGYCPQFDSIVDVLSGREMLRLLGRLRGLPRDAVEREAEHWLAVLGIAELADRQCGSYSGGNKRKLNVALALMGDPPVVFLDEPSTGVDPVARRRLWNIIAAVKHNGQSVVLTSHSMEECEALCDRLSIMVNGQFQCLGGCQHLKNKFGQGFTILLKLNTRDLDAAAAAAAMKRVKALVQSSFNLCSVKDEHKDYVHFHVGDAATSWHRLFQTMEGVKRAFPAVEDYSVSETTLEQVFLGFAKNQRADERQEEKGQQGISKADSIDSFVSIALDSDVPEA